MKATTMLLIVFLAACQKQPILRNYETAIIMTAHERGFNDGLQVFIYNKDVNKAKTADSLELLRIMDSLGWTNIEQYTEWYKNK